VSAPSSPHDVSKRLRANTDEVEITNEMIMAGRQELLSFDRRYESDEDAVGRIYRAMIMAESQRRRRESK
jgi:5-formaminoimidazole-4-carboxamide-1-beta-D-ribofuranosyl 5'-monophosphate synthetase